jgi:hypothetical protein
MPKSTMADAVIATAPDVILRVVVSPRAASRPRRFSHMSAAAAAARAAASQASTRTLAHPGESDSRLTNSLTMSSR